MKSIVQKRIIPVRTQSQDEKFSNQLTNVKYTKVRSGHNICCSCSSLVELAGCRVTYENFPAPSLEQKITSCLSED